MPFIPNSMEVHISWLVYKPDRDVMTCNVCTNGLKYQAGTPGSFVTGTKNFKIVVMKKTRVLGNTHKESF